MTEPVPCSFEGIPILNNQKSWFFGYEKDRAISDIDRLWDVFAAANLFVSSDEPEARSAFAATYDAAIKIKGVAWNLSTGLYWIRPWNFPTLDKNSRSYISNNLKIRIDNKQQDAVNANSYLRILEHLSSGFLKDDYPVHSFPELSLAAWPNSVITDVNLSEVDDENNDAQQENDNFHPLSNEIPLEPYTIEDILTDGCFLDRGEVEALLKRLQDKKNLILQGPPGTGKTWLAKRLAYALMGNKDRNKLRVVQFHPNLSYEDFVRGLRPNINGKLESTDGVFLKAIGDAHTNLDAKFVVVIEEINRGNPAQIFGELLTLLENSKREVAEAIQLCYPDKEGNHDPVHIPENLYVIGTMNIADRSLALVDLALRRRFSFVTLEPKFGLVWREWVIEKGNLDPDLVDELAKRMESLNQSISSNLGEQFRVGHSYVTPHNPLEEGDTKNWFRQVVETEIGPLLEEYWFDSVDKAKEATKQLLKDW